MTTYCTRIIRAKYGSKNKARHPAVNRIGILPSVIFLLVELQQATYQYNIVQLKLFWPISTLIHYRVSYFICLEVLLWISKQINSLNYVSMWYMFPTINYFEMTQPLGQIPLTRDKCLMFCRNVLEKTV